MSENRLTGELKRYNPADCFSRQDLIYSCIDAPRTLEMLRGIDALWRLCTAGIKQTKDHDPRLWFLTVCNKCQHLTNDCNCWPVPKSGDFGQRHKDDHWLVIKQALTARLDIIERLVREGRLLGINAEVVQRVREWSERNFEERVGREAV